MNRCPRLHTVQATWDSAHLPTAPPSSQARPSHPRPLSIKGLAFRVTVPLVCRPSGSGLTPDTAPGVLNETSQRMLSNHDTPATEREGGCPPASPETRVCPSFGSDGLGPVDGTERSPARGVTCVCTDRDAHARQSQRGSCQGRDEPSWEQNPFRWTNRVQAESRAAVCPRVGSDVQVGPVLILPLGSLL